MHSDSAPPAAGATDIHVLYDGECPFCTRYVQWMRLKDNLDVHLVNAREESGLKAEATRLGYDLDRGMVVKYGNRFYHGDQAMVLLSALSTPSDVFNRLMARMFRSSRRAAWIYPILAFIRKITVIGLGRGTIGNLK